MCTDSAFFFSTVNSPPNLGRERKYAKQVARVRHLGSTTWIHFTCCVNQNKGCKNLIITLFWRIIVWMISWVLTKFLTQNDHTGMCFKYKCHFYFYFNFCFINDPIFISNFGKWLDCLQFVFLESKLEKMEIYQTFL